MLTGAPKPGGAPSPGRALRPGGGAATADNPGGGREIELEASPGGARDTADGLLLLILQLVSFLGVLIRPSTPVHRERAFSTTMSLSPRTWSNLAKALHALPGSAKTTIPRKEVKHKVTLGHFMLIYPLGCLW